MTTFLASCPSGQDLDIISNTCQDCPIGFYKNNSASDGDAFGRCVECSSSGFRTLSTGAVSESDCNVGKKSSEIT